MIEAKLGQNTMLPCPYQHSTEDATWLQWAKISEEGSEELLAETVKRKVSSLQSTRYNTSSDLSLTIRSVSFMDASIYRCFVSSVNRNIPPSTYDVILQVSGASNETIKGHVGESVTFTCPSSSETKGHTNAYWKKYSHGLSQGSPNATFHHGTTTPGYTVNFDFSLSIEEISPNDEGVYECYHPGIGTTGSVLGTVYFHTYALPTTSLHIDGCESDNGNDCEQIIPVGTVAFFTCKVESAYPEKYPTWGDQTEYRDRSINSDGTFNTWSSITVLLNGTDTPAERVCTFVLEGFNMSSRLTVRGMFQVFTALIVSNVNLDP
ncbi:uncharacterized protein [Diadema setosum]|uniref:uncharacterized protein n=1 Tax=Diadema setosum TaxID=31175 RepID=UPI003B3B23B7